jgi:hypothetical protein
MLLKVHVILIACAILFCFGFALYVCVLPPPGTQTRWLTAGVFTLFGFGLALYLRPVLRRAFPRK